MSLDEIRSKMTLAEALVIETHRKANPKPPAKEALMATALSLPLVALQKTIDHLDTLMEAKEFASYAVALAGLGPLVEAVVREAQFQAEGDLSRRLTEVEAEVEATVARIAELEDPL